MNTSENNEWEGDTIALELFGVMHDKLTEAQQQIVVNQIWIRGIQIKAGDESTKPIQLT